MLDYLLRESGLPDWRCAEVAARFALADRLDDQVRSLSGGYQTRVKLCGMLLQEPNCIVLDEPTNFLDLRTQVLLEDFLQSYRGSALVVSHDRTFLRKTCDHTLAISTGRFELYAGDLDAYEAMVDERVEHAQRQQAGIDAKKRQLEKFIAENKANANTASQARNKSKQLARLEDVYAPEAIHRRAQVRVPEVKPRRGIACQCLDLGIGYPEKTLVPKIELTIDHGSRL